MNRARKLLIGAGIVLVLFLAWAWATHDQFRSTADRLLLLVPDNVSFSDPKVTVWLDAASEEGLHVVAVHDSQFLRPFWRESQCAGLILPDTVHKEASDILVDNIHHYVADGGKLMLVYDAGTLLLNGGYAQGRSRFSDLAGVDYALYDTLHDQTIQWGNVSTSAAIMDELGVPPGKYYPFEPKADIRKPKVVASSRSFEVQLRRYRFGDLQYPSYVTSGNYSGRILLRSGDRLAAGENNYQKGPVLFVNLPLGYLKANTDGLPLHIFLRHFALQSLSLPQLMTVPDGVGGLVLNWHVDSNASIKPLQELNSWSLMQQGPYSIHITAGPDAQVFGDKKGFDVDHKQVSQQLIREYVSRGYAIGSHGGWIHDYFSFHVDKDNPRDLQQYLALNRTALEKVTGKPVVEYSAPSGNHPVWVTHWLEDHGFIAYYFTGDTGMGPTQGYRDGVREGRNIWAFPTLHLDRAASFEEISSDEYPDAEVEHWLEAIGDFTANNHAARLIYFHAPGILAYHDVAERWLEKTAELKSKGTFRWYTMTDLAQFLNSRKQVKWKVTEQNGTATFTAIHPENLAHESWRLPASKFGRPTVQQGTASVAKGNDAWIVIASDGKELQFAARMLRQ